MKIFEGAALILAFAFDGVKFIVERVEEQGLDELKNVVAGSVMHASLTTDVGIEVGLEQCAEDRRVDGEPIELIFARMQRNTLSDIAVEGRELERVVVEESAVDVLESVELGRQIGRATVAGSVEHLEQIEERPTVIGGVQQIVDELIGIEQSGVLGVETEDEADDEFVQEILLSGVQEGNGIVLILEPTWREDFLGEQTSEYGENPDGVLVDADGVDILIVRVDEEIEAAIIIGQQVLEFDDLRFGFTIGVDARRDAIHVVDAELVEVGDDDPIGLFSTGQSVGITFCLLEGREEFAVGLMSGLIEVDAARLLFDEHSR